MKRNYLMIMSQYENRDMHPKHKAAPPQEPPQKCARCGSEDTKFCYYNNYSLSQPRYFCRECRRYWTHGGSLRNVPIGGRRGKRSRTAAVISSSVSQQQQQQLGMRLPELGQYNFPGGGFPGAFPTVVPPLSLMSLAPPRLTQASLGFWEGFEANLWSGSGAAGNTNSSNITVVKTEPTSSAPSAANSTQWFCFGGP